MEILDFEAEAMKKSVVHALDARIKLVSGFLVIMVAVYVGKSEALFSNKLEALFVLETYLIILLLLARLDIILFLKRLLFILPFGGAIAIMKPFIEKGSAAFILPFGLIATQEGIQNGVVLLCTMVVSVTSVMLLSSTTYLQDLIGAARKFGLPKEMALLLGMTVRYLFLYVSSLRKIIDAQKARFFSARNYRVGYQFILRQIGYTAAMVFVRSYQQGLMTHQSMLSRGYNPDSGLFLRTQKMSTKDAIFMTFSLLTVATAYSIL